MDTLTTLEHNSYQKVKDFVDKFKKLAIENNITIIMVQHPHNRSYKPIDHPHHSYKTLTIDSIA